MTPREMNVCTAEFLEGCRILGAKKNFDYHPDGVAMLEILESCHDTGVTVEQDLWLRLRKQLSALRRYVIEGHLESEPPIDRFRDVVNYMAIMQFWTEYQLKVIVDAINFVRESRTCECSLASADRCDRCRFLLWLRDRRDALGSPGSALPSTPKPPV